MPLKRGRQAMARGCAQHLRSQELRWLGTLSGMDVHESGVSCFSTKYSPPGMICRGGSSFLIRLHTTRQSSSGSGTPTTRSVKALVTTTGSSGVPLKSAVILQHAWSTVMASCFAICSVHSLASQSHAHCSQGSYAQGSCRMWCLCAATCPLASQQSLMQLNSSAWPAAHSWMCGPTSQAHGAPVFMKDVFALFQALKLGPAMCIEM